MIPFTIHCVLKVIVRAAPSSKDDTEEERQCTVCQLSKLKSCFSRKQWQNGKSRKCEACVGGGAADSEGQGETKRKQRDGDDEEQLKAAKHTRL